MGEQGFGERVENIKYLKETPFIGTSNYVPILQEVFCRFYYRSQKSIIEAVPWECSIKEVFLKISQNSQETPVLETLCTPQACNFVKKETPKL